MWMIPGVGQGEAEGGANRCRGDADDDAVDDDFVKIVVLQRSAIPHSETEPGFSNWPRSARYGLV